MKVSTKFEVGMSIRRLVIALLLLIGPTLRDLVTLTFDLLTLVSGHTWRVTWSTPPPSLRILRLSVLELSVLTSPVGYHWLCVSSHYACAISRDLCVCIFCPHVWNPWLRFSYSLYNFYGAMMMFKGRLFLAPPMLTLFFGRKFINTVEIGPQNGSYFGKGDVMLTCGFATLKRHIIALNCVFWCILRHCPWWVASWLWAGLRTALRKTSKQSSRSCACAQTKPSIRSG